MKPSALAVAGVIAALTACAPATPTATPTGATSSPTPTASSSPTTTDGSASPSSAPTGSSAPSGSVAPSTVPSFDGYRDATVAGVRLQIPQGWVTRSYGELTREKSGIAVPGVVGGCIGPSTDDCDIMVRRILSPGSPPLRPRLLGAGVAGIDPVHICRQGSLDVVESRQYTVAGGNVTYAEVGCPGDSVATWAFPDQGIALMIVRSPYVDEAERRQTEEIATVAQRIVQTVRP